MPNSSAVYDIVLPSTEKLEHDRGRAPEYRLVTRIPEAGGLNGLFVVPRVSFVFYLSYPHPLPLPNMSIFYFYFFGFGGLCPTSEVAGRSGASAAVLPAMGNCDDWPRPEVKPFFD